LSSGAEPEPESRVPLRLISGRMSLPRDDLAMEDLALGKAFRRVVAQFA
jgi:hypothetical protein